MQPVNHWTCARHYPAVERIAPRLLSGCSDQGSLFALAGKNHPVGSGPPLLPAGHRMPRRPGARQLSTDGARGPAAARRPAPDRPPHCPGRPGSTRGHRRRGRRGPKLGRPRCRRPRTRRPRPPARRHPPPVPVLGWLVIATTGEHVTKVLIIGAGIAGPAAAIALHKAGISSEIYEAYPQIPPLRVRSSRFRPTARTPWTPSTPVSSFRRSRSRPPGCGSSSRTGNSWESSRSAASAPHRAASSASTWHEP